MIFFVGLAGNGDTRGNKNVDLVVKELTNSTRCVTILNFR